MAPAVSLKKAFRFNCSYASGSKTIGRNFVLWVTLEALSADEEANFVRILDEGLIQKFHNRDLTETVDFLKHTPINDAVLLEVVYVFLKQSSPQYPVIALELERDGSTRTLYACR